MTEIIVELGLWGHFFTGIMYLEFIFLFSSSE